MNLGRTQTFSLEQLSSDLFLRADLKSECWSPKRGAGLSKIKPLFAQKFVQSDVQPGPVPGRREGPETTCRLSLVPKIFSSLLKWQESQKHGEDSGNRTAASIRRASASPRVWRFSPHLIATGTLTCHPGARPASHTAWGAAGHYL